MRMKPGCRATWIVVNVPVVQFSANSVSDEFFQL